MKPEDMIVMTVALALVAVIGFLVVNMMTGFLNEGGLVYNFFYDLLEIVINQITSIIE